MIKLKIVHIAIFSFILLISSVLASTDVDVKLSSNDMIGYAGETSSVDIIIKNNQNGADTFTITTSPYQFAGVVTSLEKFIVPVNAG